MLAESYDRLTKDAAAARARTPQMTIGMVSAVAHDSGLRRVFGEQFIAPADGGFPDAVRAGQPIGELPRYPVRPPDRGEVVYPLATAPAAGTRPAPACRRGREKPHERR
jgi:hypothetical protein